MSDLSTDRLLAELEAEGVTLEDFLARWNAVARFAHDAAESFASALVPVLQQAAIAFEQLYVSLDQAGMVPPRYPAPGDRWTSPIDGTRYKAVGGKRGKPVHWQPVRERWWR